MAFEKDHDILNLEATELRLGLPGRKPDGQITCSSNKRSLPCDINDDEENQHHHHHRHHHHQSESKNSSDDPRKCSEDDDVILPPPAKTQVVGWPPVRSYRKNSFQIQQTAASKNKIKKKEGGASDELLLAGMFIKVSMDGAPFLRKIDLNIYHGYPQLLQALELMFNFSLGKYCEREGYNGSEYVPTYEDKDGDWMLVGDVPWEMFINSCKKLRIMKGSEARGLGGAAA